jgi:hypothetical protein
VQEHRLGRGDRQLPALRFEEHALPLGHALVNVYRLARKSCPRGSAARGNCPGACVERDAQFLFELLDAILKGFGRDVFLARGIE